MNTTDDRSSHWHAAQALLAAFALAGALAAWSCARHNQLMTEPGSYPANNPADCLPPVTLIDQYGKPVSLASLKGKPVLIDFIYTRCPGPCETMTLKMTRIADELKPQLGSDLRIVSISLDPEYDSPARMLAFAKNLGAERKGWLFLTGNLSQIEQVLKPYRIKRVVQSNGMVDHVLEMFLLGPDGKQVRLYSATTVEPQTVAGDVRRQLAQG